MHACGPFFPNHLLDGGDGALLSAPVVDFERELERLKLTPGRFAAAITTNSFEQDTFDAETADLAAALKKTKLSPSESRPIIEAHQANRKKLSRYLDAYNAWEASAWRDADESKSGKRGSEPRFPTFEDVPGQPGEFTDYFAGVVALRKPGAGEEDSREAWERLLQRPAAERKYKSTWAAFMLGKSWDEDDDDKAVEYFQQTRAQAKQRFTDSLGLAVAALGLEARVELRRKHFQKAIKLYLEQYAAGDGSAVVSLRCSARQALEEGADELRALAAEANTRSLITAYLISGERQRDYAWNDSPPTNSSAAWLAAVEAADMKDMDSAERLALAAYQAGEFENAQRWVNRARNTPVAQWIQAKLLLRAGKTQPAAALLAKVAGRLPVLPENELTNSTEFADSLRMGHGGYEAESQSARTQVLGELGVLHLSRREFTQALDALLNAGFWMDAAYVAERVLTTDELKDYVDRFWPLTHEAPKTISENGNNEAKASVNQNRQNIRYLLARRLTRELRGDTAREYYPAIWQPRFDELVTGLVAGWDESRPADQRAKALFCAAFIARTNGMELLGTEVQPDWHIWGGGFAEGVRWESRATNSLEAKINLASTNEIQRAKLHVTDPERRFHYRYQAAILAWEAAKLMPNHSDDTAFVLWTAGSWLKGRYPLTADIFYKALVRRCRKTALGAEADRLRWFPTLDESGRLLPRAPAVVAEIQPALEDGVQIPAPDDPATDVAPAGVEGERDFEYTVEPGDTLVAIVKAFGEHGVTVSVAEVLAANPGLEPRRMATGRRIFIPAAPRPTADALETPP